MAETETASVEGWGIAWSGEGNGRRDSRASGEAPQALTRDLGVGGALKDLT